MRRVSGGPSVDLRFFVPPSELRPFVTALYHTEVRGTRGTPIEDWLHPEWGNLRLFSGSVVEAGIGDEPPCRMPRRVLAGPTSRTTRFRVRDGRFWGVGLLPLGWARAIDGKAHHYADRLHDARRDAGCARLARMASGLFEAGSDIERERDHIVAHLFVVLAEPSSREERVVAVQEALLDPMLRSVAHLAERVHMTPRTLERFALAAFGFTPQTLLRRQRFLRSLARFMLDPSLAWIDTLDQHYHDQAHFVRDFRRFMCMSPSEYARLPHPVLKAAARARMEVLGEAVQGLHPPSAPER